MNIECLTVYKNRNSYNYCEVLCGPNEMCGPDYGVGCMPECDPADDE